MKKFGISSIEDMMKFSGYKGTAKEMQFRMLLHEIRQAEDEGKDIPIFMSIKALGIEYTNAEERDS